MSLYMCNTLISRWPFTLISWEQHIEHNTHTLMLHSKMLSSVVFLFALVLLLILDCFVFLFPFEFLPDFPVIGLGDVHGIRDLVGGTVSARSRRGTSAGDRPLRHPALEWRPVSDHRCYLHRCPLPWQLPLSPDALHLGPAATRTCTTMLKLSLLKQGK
jgi:hypothetical protein